MVYRLPALIIVALLASLPSMSLLCEATCAPRSIAPAGSAPRPATPSEHCGADRTGETAVSDAHLVAYPHVGCHHPHDLTMTARSGKPHMFGALQSFVVVDAVPPAQAPVATPPVSASFRRPPRSSPTHLVPLRI